MKFEDLIQSSTPLLVDFYATWCGPCKMMKPVLEELKRLIGDRARIITVDVDKNPWAAMTYRVTSVPTLALFQNGQLKWRHSGVLHATALRKVVLDYADHN